jgi:cell division protein FtsW
MSMTEKRTDQQSLRQRREAMLARLGLDEKHKMPLAPPTPAFWTILTVTVLFTALGLIMVLSSSSVVSLHSGGSAWSLFARQCKWALFGAIGMWGAYKVPYHTWRKTKWLVPFIGISVFLNILVRFVGRDINGARAWLQYGNFRLQPSEFMKLAVVLFCADFLSKRHKYVAVNERVLRPMLCVLGLTAGLCVLQKDFGTALVFIFIVLSLMFFVGIPWKELIWSTVGIGGVGVLVLMKADNASRRLFAFRNLSETKRLDGYQVYQSLLSIANGGVGGTGIGSGTSKWGYVPLAYSDFVFAVISEELGLVGTVAVIGGYALLVFFGVRTALGARDMHGAFIAGGISAWFGFQTFINIGGIVGIIPMTGLTLPFMSYGGSSLMVTMIASGLLLNVARHMK